MAKVQWLTAVVSAAVGAGLMLFAVGGQSSEGIKGWTPVNHEAAAALEQHSSDRTQAAGEQSATKQTKAQDTSTSEVKVGQQPKDLTQAQSSVSPNTESTKKTVTSGPAPGAVTADGLIHINSATLEQLQEIPGIGAKKAQAIIDYRTQHGAFKKITDLLDIKGIGEKMLQKMKPHIGL